MQLKSILKLVLLPVFVLMSSVSVFANNEEVFVNVSNSIAGLDILLTSSKTNPNTDLIFDIETPDYKQIKISSKTNSAGIAKARLLSKYTEKSGDYRVSAYLKTKTNSSVVTLFSVNPSDLDYDKSVSSSSDYLATVNETVKVDLALVDKFNNPIENRLIKVISSDSGLVFEDKNYLSDKNGKISIFLSSSREKVYFLSFLDIASGKTLNNRSKIAFLNESSSRNMLNIGNSSGPINSFQFENLPLDIKTLEYISFTLSAYDNNDQIVNGYRGRVRFSVVSENEEDVVLPADYAFVASDQGSHTFSLALLFKNTGTYKIRATDMSDSEVFGELELNIGLGEVLPPAESSIILSSPLAGTYNSNIQTISGKSQPGAKLQIFDNDILLTSLISDFEGNFTYTTAPLVNGEHKLYVLALDNNDVEIDRSIEVVFSVDTDAPNILKEEISPIGDIPAGTEIRYSIQTDKTLSSAKINFDDNVFDMSLGPENSYFLTFNAPSQLGEYPLGIELKDTLNNELNISQKLTLKIVEAVSSMPTITGLIANGTDKRVILTWDNPENLDEIDFYRIFYGVSPTELNNAIDTFTSSNTWYIPNLQNGVSYYFTIYAVGKNRDISAVASNMASAMPVLNVIETVDPDILHGTAGSEILNELTHDVSDSGPGLYVLFVLTFLSSIIFHFRKRIFNFSL
jgi:hypothetical protein